MRLLVYYDRVLAGDFSRYDQWMTTAHARGADVLLTINQHSRSATRLPTLAQYRRVVRSSCAPATRGCRTMGAWNEANHKTQPLYRRPRSAAQFYNVMRQECRGCTIVAADVLDSANMLPWVATFKRYAKRPRVWGLHSYSDANHFRPLRQTATAQLLRAVKGDVWLTEAGGIVRFSTRYRGGPAGERRAAKAVAAHVRGRPLRAARIKRVYLYHWNADPRFITWDSGVRRRERPRAPGARRAPARAQPAAPRRAASPGSRRCAGSRRSSACRSPSALETRTARRWRAVRHC